MKGQCLKATYNLMDVAICFMYIHQIVLDPRSNPTGVDRPEGGEGSKEFFIQRAPAYV